MQAGDGPARRAEGAGRDRHLPGRVRVDDRLRDDDEEVAAEAKRELVDEDRGALWSIGGRAGSDRSVGSRVEVEGRRDRPGDRIARGIEQDGMERRDRRRGCAGGDPEDNGRGEKRSDDGHARSLVLRPNAACR